LDRTDTRSPGGGEGETSRPEVSRSVLRATPRSLDTLRASNSSGPSCRSETDPCKKRERAATALISSTVSTPCPPYQFTLSTQTVPAQAPLVWTSTPNRPAP